MQLTEEGKILYEYVKKAIDNINNGENALSNLKNLEAGTIRIGISTTICRYVLMPYLEKFHKMYPSIDIQINNNVSDNLVKELRNGNLDILVLFESSTDNKDLVTIPIKKTQDIFASNKEYYELCKNNIEELKNLPLIFPKLNSNSRIHLDNYLTSNNINLKPKLEVLSYNLIVELIKSGFGIGYVTKEFLNKELDKNELYEIKISPSIPKRTIVIATMNKKEPNYAVKKLIEILTKDKI